jgi:hypothetical protein
MEYETAVRSNGGPKNVGVLFGRGRRLAVHHLLEELFVIDTGFLLV